MDPASSDSCSVDLSFKHICNLASAESHTDKGHNYRDQHLLVVEGFSAMIESYDNRMAGKCKRVKRPSRLFGDSSRGNYVEGSQFECGWARDRRAGHIQLRAAASSCIRIVSRVGGGSHRKTKEPE